MTTAVALTRQGWRKKITEAWQELTTSTVEGIIKVGNLLTKAKANLPHGEWLKLIEKELPITRSTTARFIKIANDERITNVAHALHLPPSWDTLYQLTRLNDKTFDRLLTKGVIRPDLQRNEITRVHNIEMRKKDEARVRNLEPIEGAFKTLIIDPPWDYEWLSVGGASAPKYATMTHEQLLAMPVPAWAERDCHMYLWTTNNFMTRAVDLMQHWGFQHKTVLTWIKTDSKGKPKIGLGTYFRNTTEQVLFGVRGELRTRTASARRATCQPAKPSSARPVRDLPISMRSALRHQG
jgi:N6-adenosine-specific RNA methylase IME4